jgi:Sigma-70 region 2
MVVMVGSLVRERIGPSSLPIAGVAPADVFRVFIDARLDEAYWLATFMLGSRPDAEDAVHDAAISAWRHWPDRRRRISNRGVVPADRRERLPRPDPGQGPAADRANRPWSANRGATPWRR